MIAATVLGAIFFFFSQSFYEAKPILFLAWVCWATPSTLFLVLAGLLAARIPKTRLAYSLWGLAVLSIVALVASIPTFLWSYRWFGHIVLFMAPIAMTIKILMIGLLARRLGRIPFVAQ